MVTQIFSHSARDIGLSRTKAREIGLTESQYALMRELGTTWLGALGDHLIWFDEGIDRGLAGLDALCYSIVKGAQETEAGR